MPSEEHFQFPELQTLCLKRLDPTNFIFRNTLVKLQFQSHLSDLYFSDLPSLKEVKIETSFFIQFKRLPALEIIKSDSCQFVFYQGGIQELPFLLEKAQKGGVFIFGHIKKFTKRLKRIKLKVSNKSPLIMAQQFPQNEAILLEFPNYMDLIKDIKILFPFLKILEILIPHYVNFQDCSISIPTLQIFQIESKGEGAHLLVFEKQCQNLKEVLILNSWQRSVSIQSRVQLQKLVLNCKYVSICSSHFINFLSLGFNTQIKDMNNDFAINNQILRLSINCLQVKQINTENLNFSRLRVLSIEDEKFKPIYKSILERSPQLQELKLIGIHDAQPIKVSQVESIEIQDCQVSFDILSKQPVIGKNGYSYFQIN